MKYLRKPTIQNRFTLVLILVITAILSLLSAIFIINEKNTIERDLITQLDDATALARTSLSSALWQYNYDYVADIVESLFLYKDIVFAQVLSGDDSVTVKIATQFEGRTFDELAVSGQFISRSAEIRYKDFEIGHVRLCMTRERMRQAVTRHASVTLVLLILIIAAIFVTVYFLSRNHIFKPLADLETSANMIARGDLDAHIKISGHDEIGQLAATFKQMMDNLKTITASKEELDHEIQERKRAELAMRMERDRAQTYLDIAGVMLVAIDTSERVILINRRGCEILDLKEKDIIGRNWFEHFIEHADTEASKSTFHRMISGEAAAQGDYENYVTHPTGTPRLMSWHSTLLQDKQGRVIGTLSSGADITDRRQAENRLRASLEEKEILLREIHHRVKNNLQMIQSLLNLQAGQVDDPRVRQSVVESNNRIKSMAMIHETLYRSHDIAQLNIENYFQDLVRHLKKIYLRPESEIELSFEIEELALDLDTTIACGLIVNELATNALKYAFVDLGRGRLTVRLRHMDGDRAELSIEDNGCGLPQDFCLDHEASLGLRLVAMMAEDQLQGSLSIGGTSGTLFQINFPCQRQCIEEAQ